MIRLVFKTDHKLEELSPATLRKLQSEHRDTPPSQDTINLAWFIDQLERKGA